jgi:hypothetical protein
MCTICWELYGENRAIKYFYSHLFCRDGNLFLPPSHTCVTGCNDAKGFLAEILSTQKLSHCCERHLVVEIFEFEKAVNLDSCSLKSLPNLIRIYLHCVFFPLHSLSRSYISTQKCLRN